MLSKERKFSCVLCKGTHHLQRCHKFRDQSLQQRRDLVKSKRVCHAFLSPGHFVKSCRGARICGVEGCQRRYHPLLHSSELKPKEEVKPDDVSSVKKFGSSADNATTKQERQADGLSHAPVSLLIKSRADSTIKRYSSEISKYHRWCHTRNIVVKFPVNIPTAVTYICSRFLQSNSPSATVSVHAVLK